MTNILIQFLIVCWVTEVKLYFFPFLFYKYITIKNLWNKDVSLFLDGKCRVLIQMKSIRLFYK